MPHQENILKLRETVKVKKYTHIWKSFRVPQ